MDCIKLLCLILFSQLAQQHPNNHTGLSKKPVHFKIMRSHDKLTYHLYKIGCNRKASIHAHIVQESSDSRNFIFVHHFICAKLDILWRMYDLYVPWFWIKGTRNACDDFTLGVTLTVLLAILQTNCANCLIQLHYIVLLLLPTQCVSYCLLIVFKMIDAIKKKSRSFSHCG